MQLLIKVRKKYQVFGRGILEFLKPRNKCILAYTRSYGGDTVLIVQNLADTPQPAELDLGQYRGTVPVEMLGGTHFPPVGELPYMLTLSPYGFYWFFLEKRNNSIAGMSK